MVFSGDNASLHELARDEISYALYWIMYMTILENKSCFILINNKNLLLNSKVHLWRHKGKNNINKNLIKWLRSATPVNKNKRQLSGINSAAPCANSSYICQICEEAIIFRCVNFLIEVIEKNVFWTKGNYILQFQLSFLSTLILVLY